jgi:hypothetical protein
MTRIKGDLKEEGRRKKGEVRRKKGERRRKKSSQSN